MVMKMLTIRNFEAHRRNGTIFRARIITIGNGKITVNGVEATPDEFKELIGGGFLTFAEGETTNTKEKDNGEAA